ncbi:phosphatidate cytidylyltransferase [Antricoccus suffuscus]|nr:phosphatidate cytidylyltransferase [Antricoccus suffuscus]
MSESSATSADCPTPHEPVAPAESAPPTSAESPDQAAPSSGMPPQIPGAAPPPKSGGRAGRDLGAAIGIGLLLGAVAVTLLYVYRPAFVILIALAACIGVWEIVRAVGTTGALVPISPLLIGTLAMLALAWYRGIDGLTIGLLFTVLAVVVWRMADSADGYLTATSAGVFIAVYVPFLAGFAVLLAVPDDGATRVIAFIAAVVCSDTGGYIAGVLFGKHPMAPTISPKKSWEGLGGSLVGSAVFGVLMFTLAFEATWWKGLLYGLAIAATATLGDLGESMIKRDIGVKDMGTLLPGHGGVMDRLDSLLPSAAVAFVLLSVFVPVS